MRYRIAFTPLARRQLGKLIPELQERVRRKIEDLSVNPYPIGTKKLLAVESQYRVRVGDYRILYAIHANELLILVVKIDHRSKSYRHLD